jgi:hypothetical protein
MPPSLEPEFPFAITVLCYTATAALIVILILLFRINTKLTYLSAKLSRSGRSAKLEAPEAAPNVVEAGSGTHFEEFLNEDAQRRSLTKKEQFKAYRIWRAEKGLNWTK